MDLSDIPTQVLPPPLSCPFSSQSSAFPPSRPLSLLSKFPPLLSFLMVPLLLSVLCRQEEERALFPSFVLMMCALLFFSLFSLSSTSPLSLSSSISISHHSYTQMETQPLEDFPPVSGASFFVYLLISSFVPSSSSLCTPSSFLPSPLHASLFPSKKKKRRRS